MYKNYPVHVNLSLDSVLVVRRKIVYGDSECKFSPLFSYQEFCIDKVRRILFPFGKLVPVEVLLNEGAGEGEEAETVAHQPHHPHQGLNTGVKLI